MNDFIFFDGDEEEQEFLKKCLLQWEMTSGKEIPDLHKIIEISTVFIEIRDRLDGMNGGNEGERSTSSNMG